MKKYMVVTKVEGECGGFAEVYERQEPSKENDYMGGYVLAWC